jgi:hypothetical protein
MTSYMLTHTRFPRARITATYERRNESHFLELGKILLVAPLQPVPTRECNNCCAVRSAIHASSRDEFKM